MKRKSLSFSQYLFFSVIAIYCVFVASFLYYQYHREKTHKVELLNSTLTMFNVDLYDHMADTAFSVKDYVARYRIRHHLQKLRVTLVDRHGKVIFDNDISSEHVKDNHLDREEIREALAAGSGYSIKRTSETLGEEFFYSANYFPEKELFVRSALPYDTDLIAMLNADKGYLWFSFLLSAILFLVFYNLTARLGAMITQLRLFARRADQDEAVDTNDLKGLGNTDLGQISRRKFRQREQSCGRNFLQSEVMRLCNTSARAVSSGSSSQCFPSSVNIRFVRSTCSAMNALTKPWFISSPHRKHSASLRRKRN